MVSGRQAGYEDYPGCSRHLLGPAESVFAVKQTQVACDLEIKIKIMCHKGLLVNWIKWIKLVAGGQVCL